MKTPEQKKEPTGKPGNQAQTLQPEPAQQSSHKPTQAALKSDQQGLKK